MRLFASPLYPSRADLDFTGFEILTILSLLSFLDTIFGTLAPAPTLNDVVITPPPPSSNRKSSDGPAVTVGIAALALGATPEPSPPPRKAFGGSSASSSSTPKPLGGLSTNEIEVRDPARKEEDVAKCLKLLQVSCCS